LAPSTQEPNDDDATPQHPCQPTATEADRRYEHAATTADVRQFQLAQSEAGVPVPTVNSVASALRFFFTNTLDRPDLARKLVRVSRPRNSPVVLSRDEVACLSNATSSLKHQAALSVAYCAGQRIWAPASASPPCSTQGFGHHPPSPYPYDRARWRHHTGWAMELVAPGFPAAGAGARRAVPPVVPQQAARPPWCRKTWLLRQCQPRAPPTTRPPTRETVHDPA
jgi:Site-specific recombinase XerD